MLKLLLKRLSLGLLTLLIVSVLIFVGTEILPGDVATAVLGQAATPEAVDAIRRSLGLNDPAIIRYGRWLLNFVQGDFGVSLANGRPVAADLTHRLGNTMFLAAAAAVVAVPLAVIMGIAAVIHEDRFFDRASNMIGLAAISLPEFFVGYVLIVVFAVRLEWFPSLAAPSPGMDFGQRLLTIVLPAATLVLAVLAHMMRMTRASILNVLQRPYIEMATLKGIPRWRIVVQHALPNAMGPIINVIALNLAHLIVGVVVVEVIFVYPGMGQLMVDAVSRRDVPVVQACGLVFAGAYVLLNMLADILAMSFDPRLRNPAIAAQ